MGQVRHGCATTTHAIRATIMRASPPSVRGQARMIASYDRGAEPGVRDQPEDGRQVAEARDSGRSQDRSKGAILVRSLRIRRGHGRRVPATHAVAARRLSLCPAAFDPAPDQISAASGPSAPWHITLAGIEGGEPKRAKFKRYPIGCFHMDIAEVLPAEGKLYLFVAIDRTSKFAVTQLVDTADRRTAWEFLEHLLQAVPRRIHTILTDYGIQFADPPRNRNAAHSRQMRFHMICEANGIEHRLTRPNHQRSGRAHEPDNQRGQRQTIP